MRLESKTLTLRYHLAMRQYGANCPSAVRAHMDPCAQECVDVRLADINPVSEHCCRRLGPPSGHCLSLL